VPFHRGIAHAPSRPLNAGRAFAWARGGRVVGGVEQGKIKPDGNVRFGRKQPRVPGLRLVARALASQPDKADRARSARLRRTT
jgi:hypothetical protein